MRKLLTLFALTASTGLISVSTASAQSHTARIYIQMKGGKLSEVIDGKQQPVKQDITLVNGTTIHPDGKIDGKDGNVRQLQEGEYMTMDGRIRKLKDMGGAPAPKGN